MSFKRKNLHFWALYTVILKFSFLDVFTFLSNAWLTHGVTWKISLLMYDYCCVRYCYELWMRTCILRSDWLQWGSSRSSIMASKSVFSQLTSASIMYRCSVTRSSWCAVALRHSSSMIRLTFTPRSWSTGR